MGLGLGARLRLELGLGLGVGLGSGLELGVITRERAGLLEEREEPRDLHEPAQG